MIHYLFAKNRFVKKKGTLKNFNLGRNVPLIETFQAKQTLYLCFGVNYPPAGRSEHAFSKNQPDHIRKHHLLGMT